MEAGCNGPPDISARFFTLGSTNGKREANKNSQHGDYSRWADQRAMMGADAWFIDFDPVYNECVENCVRMVTAIAAEAGEEILSPAAFSESVGAHAMKNGTHSRLRMAITGVTARHFGESRTANIFGDASAVHFKISHMAGIKGRLLGFVLHMHTKNTDRLALSER